MTLLQIQALGTVLQSYYSDLNYIRLFHQFKSGNLTAEVYLPTFDKFLREYKIARNRQAGQTPSLLNLTINWLNNPENDLNSVDNFAVHLRDSGLTHGNLATSLASKILFLNNPYEVLPLDSLVKTAVGLLQNNYNEYLLRLNQLPVEIRNENYSFMQGVIQFFSIIEEHFPDIQNIEIIRTNRFLDIFLMTAGKQNIHLII